MNADKLQVLGEVDIAFDAVRPLRERLEEGRARVFGELTARAAMRKNQVIYRSSFCHRPYASEPRGDSPKRRLVRWESSTDAED
jgi:hypothetical protein